MKSSSQKIKDIILHGKSQDKRILFAFDKNTPIEKVALKYKLFTRAMYPRYYKEKSAPFHDDMVLRTIKCYKGENIVDIGFRGAAKTTIKKLVRVFILLNDQDHYRKYIKIQCGDLNNAKQIVTDIYNMCIEPQVKEIYGNVFQSKGDEKREETMSSFTLACGVKLRSGTVGMKQRGNLQDAYRPDWVWFEDIEDSETISSQPVTQATIRNCDEAIQGLDKDGSWELTGNYISDTGSVQWFINKKNKILAITPIVENAVIFNGVLTGGEITWQIYSWDDIKNFQDDALDFWGEYMCDPNKSVNKFFNIEKIERDMENAKAPTKTSGDVKYWADYQPHHRYGSGSDHSQGLGLDANTLAVFDYNSGELVADYANNEIAPDLAAHEFARVGSEFGNCLYAPEVNNKCGGIVLTTLIATVKYPKIFEQRDVEDWKQLPTGNFGWETNGKTKNTMFFEFKRDYNDGLIKIYDIEVLKEMKAYTNADLQERTTGLITRHFDLLTAVVIAWQMRKYAELGVTTEVIHSTPTKPKVNQAR